MAKKTKYPKVRGWRPTIEDERLMQELKAKLGVLNEADLLRMGLRLLAAKEGVQA